MIVVLLCNNIWFCLCNCGFDFEINGLVNCACITNCVFFVGDMWFIYNSVSCCMSFSYVVYMLKLWSFIVILIWNLWFRIHVLLLFCFKFVLTNLWYIMKVDPLCIMIWRIYVIVILSGWMYLLYDDRGDVFYLSLVYLLPLCINTAPSTSITTNTD